MGSVFAMYVSHMSTGIVVIPVWLFPHSWLITGFVARMAYVEQELSFYVMLGRSLFVLLSLFFWQLSCISFFELWLLISHLESSNLSFNNVFDISWWKPINIEKPADLPHINVVSLWALELFIWYICYGNLQFLHNAIIVKTNCPPPSAICNNRRFWRHM